MRTQGTVKRKKLQRKTWWKGKKEQKNALPQNNIYNFSKNVVYETLVHTSKYETSICRLVKDLLKTFLPFNFPMTILGDTYLNLLQWHERGVVVKY